MLDCGSSRGKDRRRVSGERVKEEKEGAADNSTVRQSGGKDMNQLRRLAVGQPKG